MRNRIRPPALVTALAGAAVALAGLAPSPLSLGTTLRSVSAGLTPADAGLVALLGTLGWLCLAWLLVAASLSGAAHLPGIPGRLAATLARRVAPAVLRRLVDTALGVSLAAGTLGAGGAAYADPPVPVPVHSASPVLGDVGPFDRPVQPRGPGGGRTTAAPAPSASPTTSPTTSPTPAPTASSAPLAAVISVAPSGGSFLVEIPPPVVPLDRPTAATASGPRPDAGLIAGRPASRPAAVPTAREVVVRRGDTLWGLAAAALGADADATAVDHEWRRWYAANRAVIGADPDLILPGQRLLVPPSTPRSTR